MVQEKHIHRKDTIKGSATLVLTALIWGFGFVAQRAGMEHIGPFLFNGTRFLLGGVTLLPILFLRRNEKAADGTTARRKLPLQGGIIGGIVLFFASNLQQVGMVFTTASKAGFLTSIYIVLVPIYGILLKRKTHWNAWISVLIGAVGLYLLCITESFSIAPGDLVVLSGALFWATHVYIIDHYVKQADVVGLGFVQFVVCGFLSIVSAFFVDGRFVPGSGPSALLAVIPGLLFTGILSSGVGFTLQGFGQKFIAPTAASLIMSLEAVFAVVGGFLLLHERLTGREIIGCICMFAAVVLSQLPVRGRGEGAGLHKN
jgi:drug/metabolite transporter (DMT)-like permease